MKRKNAIKTTSYRALIAIVIVALAVTFSMPTYTFAKDGSDCVAGTNYNDQRGVADGNQNDFTAGNQGDTATGNETGNEKKEGFETAGETGGDYEEPANVEAGDQGEIGTEDGEGKVDTDEDNQEDKDQEEDVIEKDVATKVIAPAVEKKNALITETIKTKVKVTHGMGRKVYLEKYSRGEWEKVKTYRAAEGDETKVIKVKYPKSWKNKTTTKWRIRVPQKTIKKTVEIDGEQKTLETTYKGKVKKTKTVVKKFKWPVKGYTGISSGFGWRNGPFFGHEFHPAIDIPAPKGTKVVAAASGVVVSAKYKRSYGKQIIIKHGSKKIVTEYNHLSKIKVKKGQHVKEGQVIGKVGSTGDSTGAHLDFRIFIKGKAKNPKKYTKR